MRIQMYYNKSEKDMTCFEKVRELLLRSAYSKALWECVRPTQIFYLDVVKKKVEYYNGIIKECYHVIKALKEEDMLDD